MNEAIIGQNEFKLVVRNPDGQKSDPFQVIIHVQKDKIPWGFLIITGIMLLALWGAHG